MAEPSDIKNPTFRTAVEDAERLIDEGEYNAAATKMVGTFIELVGVRPELLPPTGMEEVQPLNTNGQPRVAEGVAGLSRQEAMRKWRANWWPGTGTISVVVQDDGAPKAVWAKDRVSLSETLTYFEFLVQQLANAQKA
jgi:hypothetical protein